MNVIKKKKFILKFYVLQVVGSKGAPKGVESKYVPHAKLCINYVILCGSSILLNRKYSIGSFKREIIRSTRRTTKMVLSTNEIMPLMQICESNT